MQEQFYLDYNDIDSIIDVMDKFGNSDMPYFGDDTEGNMTMTSVYPDTIIVKTFLKNDRVRTNYFYRDGSSEEIYSH